MIPQNVQNILKQRYLKGKEKEWEDIAIRVASTAASVEKTEELRVLWGDKFYSIIHDTSFVPGGRISSEAGYSNQMMNCSVTPVNNSLENLFNETLYSEMRLYSRSGSSGFDFSKLTPKRQKTSRGYAAGPVAFMGLVSKVAQTIYQESTRDPGSMGILRIDHPDILEFIDAKSVPNDVNAKIVYRIKEIVAEEFGLKTGDYIGGLVSQIEQILVEKYQFPNFNISVAVTDDFINRYATVPDEQVITVHEKKYKTLNITYKQLFEKLAASAWKNGEPGIIFIDTINKYHPIPDTIAAANVCAEIPLLDGENCVLGHLNLIKIYHDAGGGWDEFLQKLKDIIPIGVRFLDNIIDATDYAMDYYEKMQKKNRKIGLGIMGFADILLKERVIYGDNKKCASIITELGELIRRISYETSIKLAEEKGYNKDVWKSIEKKNAIRGSVAMYESFPRRNVCLNTIAPTGSGALIAKWDDEHYTVSSGIEPLFSFRIHRTDETTGDKGSLYDWHPLAQTFITTSNGAVTSDTFNKKKPAPYVSALEISPQDHVFVLAEWQRFIDHGISKTINCPQKITKDEVLRLMLNAHDMDCKSFTIYRTGSREFEVLKDASKMKMSGEKIKIQDVQGNKIGYIPEELIPTPVTKNPRSISNDARYGITISIPTGHSKLHVTITEDEDEIPTEVFCNLGKGGTDEASSTEAMGRVISSWLQHTYTLEESLHALRTISEQLHGIGGLRQIHHKGDLVRSIWDGLSRLLDGYCDLKEPSNVNKLPKKPTALDGEITELINYNVCPECSHVFESVEKCPVCPNCGFSNCAE